MVGVTETASKSGEASEEAGSIYTWQKLCERAGRNLYKEGEDDR